MDCFQLMSLPALHLYKIPFVTSECILFYGQLRFSAEKEETLLHGRVGVLFRCFSRLQGGNGYLCEVRIRFCLAEQDTFLSYAVSSRLREDIV